LGGIIGGIVDVGVVMGAVLNEAFGGGVETLAPTLDSGGEGGIFPLIDELGLHSLLTESYAYPSGQVIVG
jgi:hypothetical protein